jgi:hypothetical protein
MHESAEAAFAQWSTDASALRIDSLRVRSLARLEETRTRYQAILVAVDQAQKAFDAFNVGVRDHATYLQNDFNPDSVAAIQEELHTLSRWAEDARPAPRHLHARGRALRRILGPAGHRRSRPGHRRLGPERQ